MEEKQETEGLCDGDEPELWPPQHPNFGFVIDLKPHDDDPEPLVEESAAATLAVEGA